MLVLTVSGDNSLLTYLYPPLYTVYRVYSIHSYLHCMYTIRRHYCDIYLGMSPIQNGGSYLMCISVRQ